MTKAVAGVNGEAVAVVRVVTCGVAAAMVGFGFFGFSFQLWLWLRSASALASLASAFSSLLFVHCSCIVHADVHAFEF